MTDIPYAKAFAKLLKQQYHVDTVFGLVGIPVVTFANDLIAEGIRFVACRNEQSASYAASAYGYLTNKPAVLLVVGGPGLIHALAGMYNSVSNKWPLVVIAGSNDNGPHQYQGTFQEMDQISLLGEYLKFKGKLNERNLDLVTFNAFNSAVQGSQGVSYIDFPGDLIEGGAVVPITQELRTSLPPQHVRSGPDPTATNTVAGIVADALAQDQNVLVVIGKGAVHSHAAVRQFIQQFNLPFLPTPMAKGVVPDSHPMNVSGARSLALKKADVVLVLGARLNWILHFGEPPKWKEGVVFVQCDSDPSALGVNNAGNLHLSLLGDMTLSLDQLTHSLEKKLQKHKIDIPSSLPNDIQDKIRSNSARMTKLEETTNAAGELNYHTVYRTLRSLRDDSRTLLVMEGANTMDKARVSFPTDYPLRRLDCGTNATMGVGLGYAMAATLAEPSLDTVLIQGDSAFGFSGMEIETLVRMRLGCVIVVMNNSGIYHGNQPESSTKLSERCRYDIVARGLGAEGHLVTNLEELQRAFTDAVEAARSKHTVTLLNVIIEHGKGSSVSFAWQNKGKASKL